jgi:hypothetical protein
MKSFKAHTRKMRLELWVNAFYWKSLEITVPVFEGFCRTEDIYTIVKHRVSEFELREDDDRRPVQLDLSIDEVVYDGAVERLQANWTGKCTLNTPNIYVLLPNQVMISVPKPKDVHFFIQHLPGFVRQVARDDTREKIVPDIIGPIQRYSFEDNDSDETVEWESAETIILEDVMLSVPIAEGELKTEIESHIEQYSRKITSPIYGHRSVYGWLMGGVYKEERARDEEVNKARVAICHWLLKWHRDFIATDNPVKCIRALLEYLPKIDRTREMRVPAGKKRPVESTTGTIIFKPIVEILGFHPVVPGVASEVTMATEETVPEVTILVDGKEVSVSDSEMEAIRAILKKRPRMITKFE